MTIKKNDKKLWNEFAKYLDIVSEVVCNRFSTSLVLEENGSSNFSSIPNGYRIWGTVVNYCKSFIKSHEPEDYGNYGKSYIIKLPNNIIDYSFWVDLDCKIVLTDSNSVSEEMKVRLEAQNKYYYLTDEDDITYVKDNGKFKTLKIRLTQVNEPKNFLNDELCVTFFHELLHAYEDYTRIMDNSKTLVDYRFSTNYDDYHLGKKVKGEYGWVETSLLRNLFHFFNKAELRAMVSEFSGEIQTRLKSLELYSGVLDDTYEIVTSSRAWKKICDAEYVLNILNNVQEKQLRDELLDIYNSHVIKGKVNTYETMIKHINKSFWHIKQIMFKKFAKLLYKIYTYNNIHSIK